LQLTAQDFANRLVPIVDKFVDSKGRLPESFEDLAFFWPIELPRPGVSFYPKFSVHSVRQYHHRGSYDVAEDCPKDWKDKYDKAWYISWETPNLGLLVNGDRMVYSTSEEFARLCLEGRFSTRLGNWYYESE
jgi:hypothetical protein